MLRSLIVAALVLATSNSFADAMADTLEAGAFDCITTGEALAGVTHGQLHEINPLGAVRACALKVPFVLIANQFPEPDRTVALHTQRAVWDGVGAHNLALIAGVSSTAATGVGIVVAYAIWKRGAEAREFARLCQIHEQMAGHPMKCNYTPTTPRKESPP